MSLPELTSADYALARPLLWFRSNTAAHRGLGRRVRPTLGPFAFQDLR